MKLHIWKNLTCRIASLVINNNTSISSRPTALIRVLRNTPKGHNASRWTFLIQSENYLTNQANRCIFFVDTERSALCLPKFKNGEIASLYEYRRRLPKMHS